MSKTALVTGAAHPMGIGFASARALQRDGFDVTVTGLTREEVALVPEQSGIRAVLLDVSDAGAIAALMAGFDRLDALVNCAGAANLTEFEPEGFIRTVEVNLNGCMRMCYAAQALLAETRGAIVNVGSMYSTFGSSTVPGYSASKGGVIQLTKSLAAAWGPQGIRVNAIAPGWIRTDMARSLWEDPTISAPIVSRTPLSRWGEPEECGDVIAFLCSPAARFVSGQTIAVDGGYLTVG